MVLAKVLTCMIVFFVVVVFVCLFCCNFLLETVVNDVLIGRKVSHNKKHEYINITIGAYHLCSINYERKAGTQLLITKSFNPTKNNLSQAMNEILLNREIKMYEDSKHVILIPHHK